uniref:Uncharacterized protein n=1 Tax=Anguilla anguilla TaxID=7936 RepID=A0A0E9R633_ANGAN
MWHALDVQNTNGLRISQLSFFALFAISVILADICQMTT